MSAKQTTTSVCFDKESTEVDSNAEHNDDDKCSVADVHKMPRRQRAVRKREKRIEPRSMHSSDATGAAQQLSVSERSHDFSPPFQMVNSGMHSPHAERFGGSRSGAARIHSTQLTRADDTNTGGFLNVPNPDGRRCNKTNFLQISGF